MPRCCDSTHCAEIALSFSRRSSRRSFVSIWDRTWSETSRCRPVTRSFIAPPAIVPSSIQHLALVRRGDLQLLAVFRDGPAREHQPFLLEDVHDLRVAERPPLVFAFDDLPD